jgi:hypothetical protein
MKRLLLGAAVAVTWNGLLTAIWVGAGWAPCFPRDEQDPAVVCGPGPPALWQAFLAWNALLLVAVVAAMFVRARVEREVTSPK